MLELRGAARPHGDGDSRVGRIAAFVGAMPQTVTAAGFPRRTRAWHPADRRCRRPDAGHDGAHGRGLASLENLSGPIAIADQAGRSAALGPIAYLSFLALISVSLVCAQPAAAAGPDGGHLLYYLVEGLDRPPGFRLWLERLQRAGMAILLALMCVAVLTISPG